MIRFDRFGWRFAGGATPALDGVSLQIARGEFVAIAGPSGSGKSTLALAMCGLLIGRQAGEPSGQVLVNSLDVAATPLHQIAQAIGLVQQNPETHFATLAVGDEIAFGMENRCLDRGEILRRSLEAMDLLSITPLANRPLGTLSGGEKQRVAVASIVAGGPDAIVLDEPTASLDPEASRSLFRTLADLCRRTGLTVVIIEHKLAQLLPLEPRLIQLQGGRVVGDAPAGLATEARVPPQRRISTDRPDVEAGTTCLRAGTAPMSGGAPLVPVPQLPRRVGMAGVQSCVDPLVDVSRLGVQLGGRTILDDVSLRLGPGELVALLGPNGGGKTTLLRCLLGLIQPTRGTVRLCGLEVGRVPVSRLAGHVGVVFQNADHQLVADTVWSEALLASRHLKMTGEEPERDAVRLLDQAGLGDRLGDHPFRLSWGQKRRLNLVSAVLHRPKVLLLDEPFAGQDADNIAFLLDTIGAVLDGPPGRRGACLMITHDARVVQRCCTRVLFLSDGRLLVDGAVPQAFDQLLELGHDAYVPQDTSPPPASGPQEAAGWTRKD